jgi:DNA-directed RNA polymerase specialized sigma24 family protein
MESDDLLDTVQRAREGDHDAWNALFLRFIPGIISHNWPDASTALVLGTVWERGRKGIHAFTGAATAEETASRLRGWLRQILRTTKINQAQRRPVRQRNSLPLGGPPDNSAAPDLTPMDDEPSALTVLGSAEELARLRTAVAKLPDEDRRLIHANFFEGRSLRSLEAEFGRDESSLRKRRDRIFQCLRTTFEKQVPCNP